MASKQIICPYCYAEFNNTEALYQCDSEERNVDGEYRCPRMEVTLPDKSEIMIRRVWPQKSGLSTRLFGPKLNSMHCPTCGYLSRRFVCKNCYNWLPTDIIEKGSQIISVIGSPSSGKTNYIVALIKQLQDHGYKLHLQVTPSQTYRDGHKEESTQNLYNGMKSTLFDQKTVLSKTVKDKKDIPWIFRLEQPKTGKNIYLVFYDTAGERFMEDVKKNAKYFLKSSAIIVTLDILSIPKIKEVLQNKEGDTITGNPSDKSFTDLMHALVNLMSEEEKYKQYFFYKKPVAFVFTKFDAVLENAGDLNFNTDEFIMGKTPIDSEFIKSKKFDLNKIDNISEVISSTLEEEWEQGAFKQFTEKWENSKFFGVSAFGTMPDENEMLPKIKPYRVMDPLVWILHQLGEFDIPVKK